jgi:CBS domain-containing protein
MTTMSQTVSEIMDPDFCRASQADSIGKLLQEMTDLGLGSVPVLDLSGHPLGVATVGDIDRCRHLGDLSENLKHPVVSVPQTTTIPEAARMLAEQNAERLVLVDQNGVAVGAVSALDLLRALLGFGVARASTPSSPPLPRHWFASEFLHLGSVGHVPSAPGVIVLESVGEEAKVLWAESALNVRERLDEMLRLPQEDPVLEGLLAVYPRMVAFRVLLVDDEERRARVLRAVEALIKRSQAPRAAASIA